MPTVRGTPERGDDVTTKASIDDLMHVRLTRKLADRLDGIDVSAIAAGDVFELPRRSGELLIAEGWAARVDHRSMSTPLDRAAAADSLPSPPRAVERPTDVRKEVDGQRAAEEARRLEDQVREELRDTRATVLNGGMTTPSGGD